MEGKRHDRYCAVVPKSVCVRACVRVCVRKRMLRRLGAACLGHGMVRNQHESKTATSSVDFVGTIFCPACRMVKVFRIIRGLELNVT